MLVLKEGAEVDANNPHECAIRAQQGRRERDEVRREVTIEKELELLPDKFLVRGRHSLRRCYGVQHTLQSRNGYRVILESPRQRRV